MAEEPEDLGFDLSLKKKKKKVKKLVALDDDDAGESTVDAPPAPVDDGEDSSQIGDDDIDFGKKKKKKKKKAFDIDAAEAAQADEGVESVVADGGEITGGVDADVVSSALKALGDLGTEFTFPNKKKRKRKHKVAEEFAENEIVEISDSVSAAKDTDTAAWANSDRDYLYTELLERVFDIMRAKNPALVQGEKRRFVMKPPQVIRLGSRKSGFINFVEICKMMHRPPDHVLGFLLAELGTSGTLDGSNALVLKGRFQQKQMESVLRRYIREYVTCHTCKSPDTILAKENRMFFLTCETCGARKSVASIKAGFSAIVGKRSRIRAAAQS